MNFERRTRRVGVELSPTACRAIVVEGDSTAHGHAGHLHTRVRSFHLLSASDLDALGRLGSVASDPAAVVAWGMRSEHLQVVVGGGRYDRMREEGPFQHIGILSLEFHVDKLSRPLL